MPRSRGTVILSCKGVSAEVLVVSISELDSTPCGLRFASKSCEFHVNGLEFKVTSIAIHFIVNFYVVNVDYLF
jgi:hypothetical protein